MAIFNSPYLGANDPDQGQEVTVVSGPRRVPPLFPTDDDPSFLITIEFRDGRRIEAWVEEVTT